MKYKKYKNILAKIGKSEANSFSLYGVAVLALINKSTSLTDKGLLLIKQSAKKIRLHNRSYTYISDSSPDSYYVSHHYNFILNLLSLLVFRKYKMHFKLQQSLSAFLRYEAKKLSYELNYKTIGFEFIVRKYKTIAGKFIPQDLLNYYINLADEKVSRKNPLALFTAEGLEDDEVKSIFSNIPSSSHINTSTFFLNSPEASIKLINNTKLNSLITKYINKKRGLPPKFKSEFFEVFWIIEIMISANILSSQMIKLVKKLLVDLKVFHKYEIGTWDNVAGISIAKGFLLRDLDTTAVMIKDLMTLNIYKSKIDTYDFQYYRNVKNKLYYTYKNDNRISVSVLAHLLDAQIARGSLDKMVINFLNKQIEESFYTDKFHRSELYVLYCLTIAYINLHKKYGTGSKHIKLLIGRILHWKKDSNLFSSIDGIEYGTVEETAWSILALNYYYNNFEPMPKIKTIIMRSIDKIKKMDKSEYSHKLWLVKQTYRPENIVDLLIEVAKDIHVK